jgi:two-component system sensor histidine kinase CpxA
MQEKPRFPLWTKILLLSAMNIAILAIVFAVFLRMQLRPEFESFLMAEARQRITAITALVAVDLQNTDASQWDEVLKRYSAEHGVTFLLYRNTGEQLAGPRTPLPPEVDVRMPRGGPPPPRRDGFGFRGEFSPRPRKGREPFAFRSMPPGPPFLAVTNSETKYWVGVRMPILEGPDREPLRSVLMLISPAFFTNSFFFAIGRWLVVAAAAVLISALCWLPLVRRLTQSIAEMMRATARIAEGRFDVALNVARHDELGHLAASINRMAGRLETFTEGRKRFLGAVAHELRSPIARMQVATGILERNPHPETQRHIDDLKEDIDLMSRLTGELLQLARAETTSNPLSLAPTNVAEAARTATRRESVDGSDIRVEVDPSIQVQANPEYLIRSFANILRNAVRYAGDRGPIRISAREENHQVRISVADSGPGVPENTLEKIFTPFYRLEDSRDRRTGGTGLGLAIVRSCTEACGGTVECRNRIPSGLEVIISLPALQDPTTKKERS